LREVRIHVPGPLHGGATLALPAQAAQHVARVLRLAPGDALTLFDGRGGEFPATVEAVSGGAVRVATGAPRGIERESPLRITLLQALARGEKMDWVVQKATELGVARLLPVACERSVVQLEGGRADKRLAHWRGVVVAACEQCGRNQLPPVLPPAGLDAACAAVADVPLRLLLAPGAARTLAAAARAAAAPGQTWPGEVALLVGPEGGLTETEAGLARRAGFEAVALGPRVLRTETAALAALALLQGLAGDLGDA
jgi:16S rRNA (uracil1498-N3)-methyltransferase